MKRKTVFLMRHNEHRDVSNGNEDQGVQAGSAVQVAGQGARKFPEKTVIPMPKEIPGTSEVSENSQVHPRRFPYKENIGMGRTVRRSTRTVGPPDRYKAM